MPVDWVEAVSVPELADGSLDFNTHLAYRISVAISVLTTSFRRRSAAMRRPVSARKSGLLGMPLPTVVLSLSQTDIPPRFESREMAEKVLNQFHNVGGTDGVKLLLRFADTKAQKQLKHQSNERRAYRAGEYNFSVEMVQGSTPPSLHRLQQTASHLSPGSQASFVSPVGAGQLWTPATSISPS